MADPLCEECGDDGLRTRDPAYRGGPRRIAGVCDMCPRCLVCDTRLAESRAGGLQVEGWHSFCGLPHLLEAMQGRTAAERALFGLDLLADPPLAQMELADVLRQVRAWLAEFTRALLAAGGEAASPAVDADAGTLRALADACPEVRVVTEMCVECDRVAARRLDFSGAVGDTAVWSLCDVHARLEAEVIRRRQRREARVPDGVEPVGAPQLRLPLRPGIKKVRLPSADASRASGS